MGVLFYKPALPQMSLRSILTLRISDRQLPSAEIF